MKNIRDQGAGFSMWDPLKYQGEGRTPPLKIQGSGRTPSEKSGIRERANPDTPPLQLIMIDSYILKLNNATLRTVAPPSNNYFDVNVVTYKKV